MRKLQLLRDVSPAILKEKHRNEIDYRIRERILMIRHVQEGKSASQVAEMLKCSATTVTKWVHRFNEHGFASLRDENRSGRPKKVNYEDLKQALERIPKEFGYPHEVWFPKLVYNYILDVQEVEIAYEYVYELIDKLRYVLLVPRTKSYKSDPEQVELFKKTLE